MTRGATGAVAAGVALGPAELARRLEALPVRIERVRARPLTVQVAGYGGGGRPSSLVSVEGGGTAGAAESVAWTADEQALFVRRAADLVPPGEWRVGDLASRLREGDHDPYTRSALELATLDLALRQAATNPFRLAGRPPRPVRFAISLAASKDPAASVADLLGRSPGARVKLDIDAAWGEDALDALAPFAASLVVLDLKLRGDAELALRLHARFPAALLEDPALPPGTVLGTLESRIAYDAPLRRAPDVERLPVRPAAVNVKPSRMGGFLEALEALEAARRRGIAGYVGGMFEVGPGRRQSQVLASLFTAGAWNDLAPLPALGRGPWASSPLPVPGDFVGLDFGP